MRRTESQPNFEVVTEITFNVERCEESGWLSAAWDAPGAGGGIVTQGKDLDELQAMIKEAVRCHFGEAKAPRTVRLHFLTALHPVEVVSADSALQEYGLTPKEMEAAERRISSELKKARARGELTPFAGSV